jgi:membrane-bound lytic murein transglycosylase F
MKPTWKICILLCFLLFLLLSPVLFCVNSGKVAEQLSLRKGKDTLVVAVRPNTNDFYLFRGEAAGFHLELIRAYAYTNRRPYRIYWEADESKRWQALLKGKVSVLVGNQNDSALQQYHRQYKVFYTTPLEHHNMTVWVVNKEHRHLLADVNTWIAYYLNSPENDFKQQAYFVLRNQTHFRLPAELSEYDRLIRHYAKQLNWDWRLLASLIYQESRFQPNAESYRGAYGLMQITPVTADHFNLDNLDNPQSNIAGGTRILQSLQKVLSSDTASMYDNTCFILAAYNAGASRVAQCRHFAATMGKNPYKWEDVAAVIPLMKHPVYYENDDNITRFRGAETLNYVEEIMERFELYKVLLPD